MIHTSEILSELSDIELTAMAELAKRDLYSSRITPIKTIGSLALNS